jgi:glycosyltransferase involved in cell wall biosynthesis
LEPGTAKNDIKVCAFSYYFPPHFSGAGLYAFTLAKEFAKNGVRFIFVTVDNSGLPRKEEYLGFEVYRVQDGVKKHGEFVLWWNLWRTFSSLRSRFDIIHAFGSTYRNSVVGPISKLLGKKSLTTVSLANNDLHPLAVHSTAGRIQKAFLSCVDRYVTLSRQITHEVRTLPLDFAKAIEIPQGVDTARFRPANREEQAALRQRLELPDGPLALYVGVLDSRKNVKWLVETWAKYQHTFAQWRLLLVGPTSRDACDAGLREQLSRYARECSLADKILLRDFAPRIEDYYRAADLFILPSQNEGMPNVLVEAMACGLPCVVTSISGTTDLIEQGKTGMLFVVNSERSFLDAMGALIRDPEQRTLVAARARTVMTERFSTDRICSRYLDVYHSMLKGKKR